MMVTDQSKQLFERATKSIPGGVNSPVRAFNSVGGSPVFLKKAAGAYLWDEDGNRYIDYINSWGPMILGHAYPLVIKAIQDMAANSTSFGAPTLLEVEMAELVKTMAPGVDLIRMVSSGTEACMSAIRLARGFTGRNKILKFEGCYHGHADSFLVKAGSGLATFNIQSVPGVTKAVADDTLTCGYNDLEAVEKIVANNKGGIACIIIEPVAGNMGCVPPQPGFLEGLRKICDNENILLVFDEVMTGFRLAAGGAQEFYNIKADIVVYGKVIGGGLPVGAFAARKDIMQQIAPLGKVYQAGTLSGNPIAMVAGLTLLSTLKNNPEIYQQLEQKSEKLQKALEAALNTSFIPYQINRVGSMISLHFSNHAIVDFNTAAAADIELFKKYFHFCLQQGIYLPPSPFETWFVSNAISDADIDYTAEVLEKFLKQL